MQNAMQNVFIVQSDRCQQKRGRWQQQPLEGRLLSCQLHLGSEHPSMTLPGMSRCIQQTVYAEHQVSACVCNLAGVSLMCLPDSFMNRCRANLYVLHLHAYAYCIHS